MWVLLSSLALAGGPLVTVDGECPGVLDIRATGVAPSASVIVVRGTGLGGDVLADGPCEGVATSLEGMSFVGILDDADFDGAVGVSPRVRGPACGGYLQVVDISSCARSNVVALGEGDEDCLPTGDRAPFDALAVDTAAGCWDGNPCAHDLYAWTDANGQNFQSFGTSITCSGASTCVSHVGITTYGGSDTVCQGAWDVDCDGLWLGRLETLGRACEGSAMSNGCSIEFPARLCTGITFTSVEDGDPTLSCCGGSQPDSMITAVSAW